MPYYYVHIYYMSKLTRKLGEISCHDMSKKAVRKRVAEPFINGEEFMLEGRRIDPHYVESINIFKTERSVKEIAEKTGLFIETILRQLREGDRGIHVTNKFITSPPHARKRTAKKLSKNVFIVHGRDHKPMKELKAMLSELDLNPIVLHEQPSGSRTIVEKLEKYSDVGYAFVLLTPDDFGCSGKNFRKVIIPYLGQGKFETIESIDESVFKKRARQNVVLEFGYFMGMLSRDRVCCLYKGNVELPSDMHGIIYMSFKESVRECRGEIIKELKAVGYRIEI